MLFNPHCFDGSKTEGERDGELRAYQQRQEEISKLPVEMGWRNFPLRLYHGFWFHEPHLNGVISIRRNFCRPAPSDLFLVTFPKSGTTWLKALAFAITNRSSGHHINSGHRSILSRHPQDCSPYLEAFYAGPQVPDLDAMPSPRLLGTHMPYSLLPESLRDEGSPSRIIYLCREPKDTLVSTVHFINTMGSEQSSIAGAISMDQAVELFCKGLSPYGPVWEHQLEYWRESQRRPDKLLFLKYEDVMAEPEANVRKLANFIGRPFSPEEESSGLVAEIVELCCFEKLSGLEVNRTGVRGKEIGVTINNSSFFRKGKVGDWREHLLPEMAEKVDVITRDMLQGTGLSHSPEPPAPHADQGDEMP
ncbi:Cytosolic sulfotransferase 15 [Platanthera guangdongensis]|uniref:Sulfotransferase n=1 Tax=Platanthera guangdongensis TaxID=2320717 RepID=A0ABR2MIK9_9ASPA